MNQAMFTVFIFSFGLCNTLHALTFHINSQQLGPMSSKHPQISSILMM